MSFTIAVAGSRGKHSVVALETIGLTDNQDRRIVRVSQPLPQSSPEEQLAVVLAVEKAVIAENGGAEPRVIIENTATGAVLYEYLLSDYKLEPRLVEAYGGVPRRTWPMRVSHLQNSSAEYVPFNTLAARLGKAWREHRLEFAPDLKSLEKQVAAFAPVETKAGGLVVADEADHFSGEMVALMYALVKRGLGPTRYLDRFGKLWPSKAEAVAFLGHGA